MINQTASFARKWQDLKDLLDRRNREGILLDTQASAAWLTGARTFINMASAQSILQLYVTRERIHVIVNNIEAQRIEEEECSGLLGVPLSFSFEPFSWYDTAGAGRVLERLTGGKVEAWLPERDCAEELRVLQRVLDPFEQSVLQNLGQETAQAVEEIAATFPFGESEFAVSGRLASALWERGIEPIVLLVAGDQRSERRRHPLPTHTPVTTYAILSVCGRRNGLVASVTRSVQRGPLSIELRSKQETVAYVDAMAIAACQPGMELQEIFAVICEAYEKRGYKNEWTFHHQGGLTGYASRTQLATATAVVTLQAGMAFAFNPTVAGAKSEDTCLLGDRGATILTQSGGLWPMLDISVNGISMPRPAVLER